MEQIRIIATIATAWTRTMGDIEVTVKNNRHEWTEN